MTTKQRQELTILLVDDLVSREMARIAKTGHQRGLTEWQSFRRDQLADYIQLPDDELERLAGVWGINLPTESKAVYQPDSGKWERWEKITGSENWRENGWRMVGKFATEAEATS